MLRLRKVEEANELEENKMKPLKKLLSLLLSVELVLGFFFEAFAEEENNGSIALIEGEPVGGRRPRHPG